MLRKLDGVKYQSYEPVRLNKNLYFSQEKLKKINETSDPVFSVSCHANSGKVGIHAPLIRTIKENV